MRERNPWPDGRTPVVLSAHADDLGRVRADGRLGGSSDDRTGGHIEAAAVTGAADHRSGELSIGQGAAAVCARVVDGMERPVDVGQRDAGTLRPSDAGSAEGGEVWYRYLRRWTAWNTLRTILGAAASALLVISLV